MLALVISTDTVIAVIVTALVCGVVPAILLVIKIINEREARIADRMNSVAERTAGIEVLERESRANVKELWKERDDLQKSLDKLNHSLRTHSQLLEAVKVEDSS
jgi:F0F1-type ATP synthase membrane subunit b/b'